MLLACNLPFPQGLAENAICIQAVAICKVSNIGRTPSKDPLGNTIIINEGATTFTYQSLKHISQLSLSIRVSIRADTIKRPPREHYQ